MHRLSVALAFVLASQFPLAAADSPSALVAGIVKAHGGSKAWSGKLSIEEQGKLVALMRHSEGAVTRKFSYPSSLRIEIAYPEATESRILENGRGWRDGEEVTGPQLDAMILQAARLALPRFLSDHAALAKDDGEIERDGKKYRQLTVALTGGATLTVQADPVTMRIARSISRAPVPQMPNGAMEFVTDYDDYRTVDGLLIPFSEINYAQGQKTGVTTLDKVTVTNGTGKPTGPTA